MVNLVYLAIIAQPFEKIRIVIKMIFVYMKLVVIGSYLTLLQTYISTKSMLLLISQKSKNIIYNN